ncbi:MAG: hypothetical protein ACLSG8_11085 [Barnesiella sp.]
MYINTHAHFCLPVWYVLGDSVWTKQTEYPYPAVLHDIHKMIIDSTGRFLYSVDTG